jgi:hypothetical protein
MTSIFEHPFSELILPFILIFVMVFAILQKSKLLGEGKKQVDALVALAIGLILIITPPARIFIVKFVPWLAVALAVMLVFLVLYGFVAEEKWKSQKWVLIVFGILAGLFVIIIAIYASGYWDTLRGWFSGAFDSSLVMNIVLIAIVIAVVLIAVLTAKNGGSTEKKG